MNTYTDTEIAFHQAIATELSRITGDDWHTSISPTSSVPLLTRGSEENSPTILMILSTLNPNTFQFVGTFSLRDQDGSRHLGSKNGMRSKQHEVVINVSKNKPIPRIAKEIANRLLPEYLLEWKERYDYYLSNVKYAEEKKDLAAKLYVLLGKPLLSIGKKAPDDYYIPKTQYKQGQFAAKTVNGLDFVSNDELTLTLGLTGDQAEKVIKLLIENNL